jgi:branched-chain amino acid transport system ATP-binding protein
MKLLEASRICLSFKGVRALDNVDLSIDKGELVGIIGPNGSGKSTLFNVLSGIYRVDAGSIHLDGVAINGFAPSQIVQRGLVRTFQNKRLFGSMTVLENVLVAALKGKGGSALADVFTFKHSRQGMAEAQELAHSCLHRVNLSSLAAVQARELPYGAQNRLEIARALALEPKLLLLDEPAAGLNPPEREELRGLIAKVHSDGVTIALVEHDVRMVTGLCRRIIALDHGVKIADGLSQEVINNPQVLEAYFGDIESEEARHA